MRPIEYKTAGLKSITFEMLELIKDQILITKDVVINSDQELSSEVMRKEKHVNALEISIDRECEQFLAMQRPVASDLRFTIAILKISGSLERIGDHAYRICSFVFDDLMNLSPELIEMASLPVVFDEIESMLTNIYDALDEDDSDFAKRVFKQDKVLDKVNRKLHKTIAEKIKENPDNIENYLLLAKTISKLERVGDLIKNMAEDIIFYEHSKIVKHQKKDKRIDKKLS